MLKPILAATLLATTALPVAAFDLSAMSEAERAAFGEAVRDYLMENPEVILEAVNSLEERQRAEQAEADDMLVQVNAEEIFDDGFSWVGGNPEGDITVVEFLDYRCGYCRRAHPEVSELIESDGNIRYVVKEFPILGPDSEASSRFAVATKQLFGDAAYKAVSDALMELKASADDATLRRLAESLDLDADAILERMDDPQVTEVLVRTRSLAQRLQISGTPTFVMGGEMLRGYLPLEGMQQVIAEERAEG